MQSIIDDFARSFALRMTIVLATGMVIAFFLAPRGLGLFVGVLGQPWTSRGARRAFAKSRRGLALIHPPSRKSALAALSTAQAWPHEEAERGRAREGRPASASIAARSSIMSSMTQR